MAYRPASGGPSHSPATASARAVTAEVVGPVKGPKIDIQKYKRRKGYHRKIGHRQQATQVRITGINL